MMIKPVPRLFVLLVCSVTSILSMDNPAALPALDGDLDRILIFDPAHANFNMDGLIGQFPPADQANPAGFVDLAARFGFNLDPADMPAMVNQLQAALDQASPAEIADLAAQLGIDPAEINVDALRQHFLDPQNPQIAQNPDANHSTDDDSEGRSDDNPGKPAQRAPDNANAPQLNPAEREEMRRLAGQLAGELNVLDGERAAIDAELNPMRRDLDAMLALLDESDMGWFEDFRKQILFELPLGEYCSITLSGADIFYALFLGAQAGCDYILYDSLGNYYIKNALYNFATKKEMLVSLVTNAQENQTDTDDLNNLLCEEFTTIFTFEKVLNTKLLLQVVTHLLACEIVKYFEHCVFPPHDGSLITGAKKYFGPANERAKHHLNTGVYPIPCNWIIDLLTSYYRGRFSVVEEYVPSVRRMLLRMTGWHHEVMDTYSFYLAKRSLALVRFLKQSNDFYTKKCQDFCRKNSEKFALLIAQMVHTRDDSSSPKNAAEEALKELIKEAHEVAFLEWVRFKHSCCAWTDLWIESALLLPIWYEAGKYVYHTVK